MSNNSFFGDRKFEERHVPLNTTANENVLSSNDGRAQIVLGGDRDKGPESGYAGKGLQDSSAIDIVCGRTKTLTKSSEIISTNPDFFTDAVRIYASEKCNVDEYFGIVDGSIGNKKSSSAIALKADDIRIIGIEGIKLVTGANPTNSNGGEIGIVGIELLAGNDDTHSQPMVKGDNLVNCLGEILDTVSNIKAQVHSTITILQSLVDNYVQHVHAPPGSSPSPQALEISVKMALESIRHSLEDTTLSSNIASIKATYFEVPSHDKNILSQYNKAN